MEDQDILRQLSMDLQVVWNRYGKSVPGLIVRPKVTSSSEQLTNLSKV